MKELKDARYNNRKYEILNVALNLFLEKGYSNTSISMVASALNNTKRAITYYFPTKEDMLLEMVNQLCDFQWQLMEQEVAEGKSSLLAYLLELATMTYIADENEVERDLYVAAYTHPHSLAFIRKNDTKKAQMVFEQYCPGWSERDYINAENIVSGIEYSMFMTGNTEGLTLDERICNGLDAVMKIYGLPEELRKSKLQKVLDMDYQKLGRRILKEFCSYVAEESCKGVDNCE